MKELTVISSRPAGLTEDEILSALLKSVENAKEKYGKSLDNVLILPPDFTRMHSYAGRITEILFKILKAENSGCHIDIMPALGTHVPMTDTEIKEFFGTDITKKNVIIHNWREGVKKIGIVPASYVSDISEGLVNEDIDVEISTHLLDEKYNLIISIGQVVPHEVVGMANYSKNIFVGCGGSSMINRTHMLGAFYGMERIMGRADTPVRRVLDYAEENYISNLPIIYILTVTTADAGKVDVHGLFTGRNRKIFEEATVLSQQKNLTFLDRPIKKAVVYLDECEFKSTWLGNKAIYRTRMAIADGGELIVLAPGVRKFGEDDANDKLIRKYGYVGRENVLKLVKGNSDLKGNLSVAAHLIHGSSDGRFKITYCPGGLTKEETLGVNFSYIPYKDALSLYNPDKLSDGWNILDDGSEIFYISNPALGLWALGSKFGRHGIS